MTKARIRHLYTGQGRVPRWFRAALVTFDAVTIGYFLYTATTDLDATILLIDLVVGLVILADFAARLWIAPRKVKFLTSVTTIADLIVLVSLLAPLIAGTNLGFFRALRMLRLVRTFRMSQMLENWTTGTTINTRVSVAAGNLVAFIFVVTSVIWVWEHGRNEGIATYVDALYFTITTLTTTGYGDITLTDPGGRIITILVMIFGVGFFLNLIQAIYRPSKVEQPCRNCGLRLHEKDASHCKHCGNVIYIETEGDPS